MLLGKVDEYPPSRMFDFEQAQDRGSIIRYCDFLTLLSLENCMMFDSKLTPMSSTIILSSPEGPKELLTTFAIACVARTSYVSVSAYPLCYVANQTIPFWSRMSAPLIFVPPRTVCTQVSYSCHTSIIYPQSVPALRGCSNRPAIVGDFNALGCCDKSMVPLKFTHASVTWWN